MPTKCPDIICLHGICKFSILLFFLLRLSDHQGLQGCPTSSTQCPPQMEDSWSGAGLFQRRAWHDRRRLPHVWPAPRSNAWHVAEKIPPPTYLGRHYPCPEGADRWRGRRFCQHCLKVRRQVSTMNNNRHFIITCTHSLFEFSNFYITCVCWSLPPLHNCVHPPLNPLPL